MKEGLVTIAKFSKISNPGFFFLGFVNGSSTGVLLDLILSMLTVTDPIKLSFPSSSQSQHSILKSRCVSLQSFYIWMSRGSHDGLRLF